MTSTTETVTQRGTVTRFAPTVTMPGGGTVTPEGWMWVLGFALAGCEWAIEAAERDNLQQKAMDYRRRQRIYWQEQEVMAAEDRLKDAEARLAKAKAALALSRQFGGGE